MAGIKTVIGQKDGKTIQKELSEEQTLSLYGKKIGDKLKGDDIGFEGYEFEITGGSDNSGIPMRKEKEYLLLKALVLRKKVQVKGRERILEEIQFLSMFHN